MGAEPVLIEAAGVTAQLQSRVRAGALRYFNAAGAFCSGAAEILGVDLPAPRKAVRPEFDGASSGLLVWRSPTETWVVGADFGCHQALARFANGREDGCFVDQTGGLAMIAVTGTESNSLLSRLGSTTAMARPGEASTARFAELCVTAVGLGPGETRLLVERVHAAHLWAWIRETLADWPTAVNPD